MARWAYQNMRIDGVTGARYNRRTKSWDPVDLDQLLDQLGQDGWELVASMPERDGAGTLFFKRQVA